MIMTAFNSLPVAVQTEVKSVLSAYSECTVEIDQDNNYKVMTATVIHNGTYNKVVGKFTKDEVFTKDEQIVNYVNSFREYPYNGYKGVKDYVAISGNWKVATLVEGDIVFN